MNLMRLYYIMRKKILKPLLAVLIITGLFLFLIQRKAYNASPGNDNEAPFSLVDVQVLFSEAESFIHVKDGLYLVKTGHGGQPVFVIYGPPEEAGITGYMGRVPFLIGIDAGHRIKGVHMLPSAETPGYAAQVSGKLKDAWTGLTTEEAQRKSMDAVTGATFTSKALTEGVKHSAGDISEEFYRDAGMAVSRGQIVKNILTLLFLTAAAVYFFLPRTSPRYGLLISILSVIIPGFLAASLLSLALFRGWAEGFFSWRTHWLLLIICIAAFGIPLFTGRNFYCRSFCPFGSAQYLIGKAYKKKLRLGRKTNLFLQGLRTLLIAAAIAVVIFDAGISLSLFEPFEAFRWNFASVFSRIIALSFLLLSAVIQKPWCRVCPTGGIIEGIRKFSARSLPK